MNPLRLRGGLLFLGLGLALVQAGPVWAGQLAVNPVQIKLGADAPTELLALRNNGPVEARYEIRAYSWSETPDGEPRLVATDEVMVFPPVLSLGPGESRNVRVGVMAAPGAVERTFRIILEELPPPVRPQGAALFLNRISIPVFLAPRESHVATSVESAGTARGAARFRLRNTGSVHVKPKTVSAKVLDARGAPVAEKSWAGWYVLPGGERVFTIDVPRKACGKVRSLDVTTRVDDHDLRQVVSVPKGVCGA
jgi:fimbrial chaperone protein